MPIDEEMLVGRHRVEADAPPLHRSAHARQVMRKKIFDAGQIGRLEWPRVVLGIGDDCAAGVLSYFCSQLIDLWKAVENSVRQLIQIRRATLGLVIARVARREPIKMLAAD